MNYLAHLYLAEDDEESRIGNLIGDFVKGPVSKTHYNPGIKKGIETHRKVDNFTDTHSIFLNSKKLLSPERRRFAGITLDLAFDHFLAKNWCDYSDCELSSFTQEIYMMLRRNSEILPDKFRSFLPRMIDEDWLGSYQNIERVSYVIERISERIERKFGRTNKLSGSGKEIEANYLELEQNFKEFFPRINKICQSLSKFFIQRLLGFIVFTGLQ